MMFSALRYFLCCIGTVLVLVGGVPLVGCKDKPTTAANPDKSVGPPPLVLATRVAMTDWKASESDPLSDPVWGQANWYLLLAPMNTSRSTPPVRVAMVYDADALHVAFVNDSVPPPPAPVARDVAAVFLDTSKAANGTEMVLVTVDSAGLCRCTWIRAGTPAVAKEDGSPEMSHPLDRLPDYAVKGLGAVVHHTTLNGEPVWTSVVTIPFKTLPLPLRVTSSPPLGGERWKINLLRTITTADSGNGSQQLQANLSPVYLGAQAVSPYRMAVVELGR
ncbi:MAG: hypothetical protein FWD53_10335 [Phycisphaerales bacterium]|nr:hypothetical protein [Phycisphaerales bacterium]